MNNSLKNLKMKMVRMMTKKWPKTAKLKKAVILKEILSSRRSNSRRLSGDDENEE